MPEIKEKLEKVFLSIEKSRMQDVPVCNSALYVEAIDFHEWEDYYFGVMLTPWFMNLMLLPIEGNGFDNCREGSKHSYVFPSGRYEFVTGREEGLGFYQVCSLFSPMFEFRGQEAAITTARIVMREVMEPRNKDSISTHESTVQKIWHGEVDRISVESEENHNRCLALSRDVEEQAAPMSRREFLRGRRRSQSGARGHGN